MPENVYRKLVRRLAERPPLPVYCTLINLRLRMRGRPIRVAVTSEHGIMRVTDGQHAIHICRRGRYLRYKRGIAAAIAGLAKDYHLHKLGDLTGGLFLDCGANVGELGFWARAHNMSYLAFEPESQEARCCDLNNFDGDARTRRKALWKENTVLSFYSKADTADGSVFESEGSVRIDVEAVTLATILATQKATGPIILKLEAEGAEPEVLLGAGDALSRIDWVSVDCGPEKGFAQEDTFVACHDHLLAHGFRLVEVGFRRITALYENTRKSGTAP